MVDISLCVCVTMYIKTGPLHFIVRLWHKLLKNGAVPQWMSPHVVHSISVWLNTFEMLSVCEAIFVVYNVWEKKNEYFFFHFPFLRFAEAL